MCVFCCLLPVGCAPSFSSAAAVPPWQTRLRHVAELGGHGVLWASVCKKPDPGHASRVSLCIKLGLVGRRSRCGCCCVTHPVTRQAKLPTWWYPFRLLSGREEISRNDRRKPHLCNCCVAISSSSGEPCVTALAAVRRVRLSFFGVLGGCVLSLVSCCFLRRRCLMTN